MGRGKPSLQNRQTGVSNSNFRKQLLSIQTLTKVFDHEIDQTYRHDCIDLLSSVVILLSRFKRQVGSQQKGLRAPPSPLFLVAVMNANDSSTPSLDARIN